MITPYRLMLAADVYRPVRVYRGRGPSQRGARTVVQSTPAGWAYWTADQAAEPQRLAGSGTFLLHGALRAVAAVRRAFRDPRVRQVSLRTNQDRTVLVYNRSADGRISYYRAED